MRITVYFMILLLSCFELKAAQFDSFFEQVQEQIALGFLFEAKTQLQQVNITEQDTLSALSIQGLKGYLALQQQNYAEANSLLTDALAQSQKYARPDLTAHFALYLGQLYEQQHRISTARYYYALAMTESHQASDKSLRVSSLCSLAKIAIVEQQWDQAWQFLQQAKSALEKLPKTRSGSQLWLNIGYQALQLHQTEPTQQSYLQTGFDGLYQALTEARYFGLIRIQASSLNYLATLYRQQQPQQAIQLLQEGIRLAHKTEAQDLLIDLYWQLAEIYKTEHQTLPAIEAYRQALKYL